MTTEKFLEILVGLINGRSDMRIAGVEPSGNVRGGWTIVVNHSGGNVYEIEVVGPE